MSAAPLEADLDDVAAAPTKHLRPRGLSDVAWRALAGQPLPPRGRILQPGTVAKVHVGAACRGADDPALTDATSHAAAAPVAERYCARCPVAVACLAVGRASNGWGVWGGTPLRDGGLVRSAVDDPERDVDDPERHVDEVEDDGPEQHDAPIPAPVLSMLPAGVSAPDPSRPGKADPEAVEAVLEHVREAGGSWTGGAGDLLADLVRSGRDDGLPGDARTLSWTLLGPLGVALTAAGMRIRRTATPQGAARLDLTLEQPVEPAIPEDRR